VFEISKEQLRLLTLYIHYSTIPISCQAPLEVLKKNSIGEILAEGGFAVTRF